MLMSTHTRSRAVSTFEHAPSAPGWRGCTSESVTSECDFPPALEQAAAWTVELAARALRLVAVMALVPLACVLELVPPRFKTFLELEDVAASLPPATHACSRLHGVRGGSCTARSALAAARSTPDELLDPLFAALLCASE